jgi:4-diphosphocytidyl-2-C-methyl-D-erythritol kinase
MAVSSEATKIALPAPAKINLGLRVLGTRADGYHLIESLMVPVDLHDEVEVALVKAPGQVRLALELSLDAAGHTLSDVPADEENLASRAARAFLDRAGLDDGVEIRLVKRIPAAAGLGGGSSDAGAVLRALCALRPGRLTPLELTQISLAIGADVPFFLAPRPALVTGIGEQVKPIGGLPALSLVLANPGESLATAAVYGAWDVLAPALTKPQAGSTMRALSDLRAAESSDFATRSRCLESLLRNDLEPAARRLCPPVGRLSRQLAQAGALAVGMSGSGATLFGVFEDRQAAEAGLGTLDLGTSGWGRVAATEGDG